MLLNLLRVSIWPVPIGGAGIIDAKIIKKKCLVCEIIIQENKNVMVFFVSDHHRHYHYHYDHTQKKTID